MKRCKLGWFGVCLLVGVLPFGVGCVQEAGSATEPVDVVSVSNTTALAEVPSSVATNALDAANTAAPEVVSISTNAVSTNTLDVLSPDVVEPEDDISTAEVKPIPSDKLLPPNVRRDRPVGEIMKLADSGVDESVFLAFVTNSTTAFNLNADEIIYLNDIGVPSAVMTAMLEHDNALKAPQVTSVWNAATPSTNEAPPPPEAMAPQPTEPPPAQTQEVAPPPSQVTYDNFYSSLAPYGTWVDVSGYGRCWQPSVVVVNPTWSPYADCGRWAYTDYGWYWASDYSWGWAPFHYGRWFNHYRLGWCWYPDTVWGPSWVTWRYTGSYCGWAPLPPCAWYRPGVGITYWGSSVSVGFSFGLGFGCYTFVPWKDFDHHHPHRYAVHGNNQKRIYDQSVVATRISGNRHSVFNRGINPDRVASASGRAVRKVAVREVNNPRAIGGSARPDRLASDGSSIAVYRPRVTDPPRAMPEAVRQQRASRSDANLAVAPSRAPGGSVQSPATVATREAGNNRQTVTTIGRSPNNRQPNLRTAQVTRPDSTPQRPISATRLGRPGQVQLAERTQTLPEEQQSRLERPGTQTESSTGRLSGLNRRAAVPATRGVPAPNTAEQQQTRFGTRTTPPTTPWQNRAQNNSPADRTESMRPGQGNGTQVPYTRVNVPGTPTVPQRQESATVPRFTPGPSTTIIQQQARSQEVPRYAPSQRMEVPRYNAPDNTGPRTFAPPPQAPRVNNQPQQVQNIAPRSEPRTQPSYQPNPAPAAPQRSFTPPSSPSYSAPRSAPQSQSGGGTVRGNNGGGRGGRSAN